MADVAISRPAANEQQTLQSQADGKYVFDFPAGDATITRDGNNLLLNFEDGGGIVIENFYETHTQENMPSFQIDGQEVAGQDFFEALNEPDLMPAAGPAAAPAVQAPGGRYHDFGSLELAGGLEHLTPLDYESGRNFAWEDEEWNVAPDIDFYINPLSAIPVESAEPMPPVNATIVPPAYNPEQPAYAPPQAPAATPEISPVPVTPPQDLTPPEPPQEVPPAGPTPPPGDTPPSNEVPTIDNPYFNPDQQGEPTPPEGLTPPSAGDTPPSGITPSPGGETPPPGDQPGGINFIPATQHSHVIVDEGALEIGSGLHTAHGASGNYFFTTFIPANEGGAIALSGFDSAGEPVTLTFTVLPGGGVAGDPAATNAAGEDVEFAGFLSGNGVSLNNFTLADLGGGNWQVNYEYALTGNHYHDRQATPDSEFRSDFSGDRIDFDYESILIRVVDGSGDAAENRINVEVHDDEPVLKMAEQESADVSTFTGSFTTTFGADGMNEIPFKIDGNAGVRDGNSWTFDVDGGQLVVTSTGGENYAYEYKPASGTTLDGEKTFAITAIDSDEDVTSGIITVRNNTPDIVPNKPTDPDDPEDPGNNPNPNPDPEDPNSPAVAVELDGMHIRVDEAAFAQDNGGKGAGHTHHGYQGTASFTVRLRGGEGGLVEIGDDYKINISKVENEEWAVTPESANTLSAGNVDFAFGEAVSEDPASGVWTISFNYALTENIGHGKPGSDTDNVLLDGVIPLKVTDSLGGDTAESKITVEIHDDAPVLEVTKTGNGKETSFTGSFTADFGADGQNEIPFKIDGNAGVRDGNSWMFDVDGGQLVVTSTGGEKYAYEYKPASGTTLDGEKTFAITAIDGDEDVANGKIIVANNKPTITPDPKDPDIPDDKPGDNPDDNPVQVVGASDLRVIADENGFTNATPAAANGFEAPVVTPGLAGSGHSGHGYAGQASFTVRLNGGEGGKIKIGDAYEIKIAKNGADEWFATPNDLNEIDADNFHFVFDNAILKDEDAGVWTIGFKYGLVSRAPHDDATKVDGDAWKPANPSISIVVTDDTGDQAVGNIWVEIHDDGPVITATQGKTDPKVTWEITTEDGQGTQTVNAVTNLTSSVKLAYGADGNATTGFLTINGEDAIYKNGAYFYEDSQGTLTIKPDNNGQLTYEYAPTGENAHATIASKSFEMVAKDADGDTATATVTVFQNAKPGFIPGDSNPNGPEDKEYHAVQPEQNSVKIIVDEAAWATNAGSGDQDHGFKGTSIFTAQINGGENGFIKIGSGDHPIVYKVENERAEYIEGGDKDSASDNITLTVDGVILTFKNNYAVDANGSVNVDFQYQPNSPMTHKDGATVIDDIHACPSIPVVVQDTVGTDANGKPILDENGNTEPGKGDIATGYINIVIHDDGPKAEASVQVQLAQDQTHDLQNATGSLSGTFEGTYGADNKHATGALQVMDADGK